MMFCLHSWAFPRRWQEFAGHTGVDVQTCAKCGARRLSPVQFGREREQDAGARETQEAVDETPSRS